MYIVWAIIVMYVFIRLDYIQCESRECTKYEQRVDYKIIAPQSDCTEWALYGVSTVFLSAAEYSFRRLFPFILYATGRRSISPRLMIVGAMR